MFAGIPPELPDLPEIQEQSTRAIRLRGLIQKQLPGIPTVNSDDLLG